MPLKADSNLQRAHRKVVAGFHPGDRASVRKPTPTYGMIPAQLPGFVAGIAAISAGTWSAG
jgi:hypothetical protein